MTMNRSVLVVAAHPDDEVLGAGGTMARLSAEGHQVHVLLLADGESSRKPKPQTFDPALISARTAAAREACQILGCASVQLEQLPDNRLDSVDLLDVVKIIEGYVDRLQPATVLTHHGGDMNVDHRIVQEAALVACRPQPGHSVKEIYFFEVPSSTEWQTPGAAQPFQPNRFVDIGHTLSVKLKALSVYGRELRQFPHPRSLKGVEILAQWRGATAGVDSAEAFMVGRQIV